jgi:hypothetical protein
MAFDFKKEYKNLYQPKTALSLIDVPAMLFIMVDGTGNPNTSEEYQSAVEILYGLSYAIKMSKIGGNQPVGYFDYVVPPLEGLWNVDDEFFRGGGAAISDKSKFIWTSMIRQPDFVTLEVFEYTKLSLAQKKLDLDTSKARLERLTEGLCVQAMHFGSYDDEPATIAAMDKYAVENGYAIDINETRRHHEIYLNDPRKTAPEKLKTVIRHPCVAVNK